MKEYLMFGYNWFHSTSNSIVAHTYRCHLAFWIHKIISKTIKKLYLNIKNVMVLNIFLWLTKIVLSEKKICITHV